MSDSSSDTESSCGWTVISNEGSDVEMLGPDNAREDGSVISAPDVPDAERGEESLGESSLDVTLREEAEPAREAAGEEHVILSSSIQNSDIITLVDSQEAESDSWEEPLAKEILLITAVQRDGGNSSSEVEDEEGEGEGEGKVSPVLRRRRVRRSSAGSEPGDSQEQVFEEIGAHLDGRAAPISSTLNKCILLALLIAISMGLGHFYGTVQIQERQKIVEQSRMNELETQCKRELDVVSKEVVENLKEDLEEKQGMVMSLMNTMDKITKENQHLRVKQEELQVQRRDLYVQLTQTKSQIESGQNDLTTENQRLKVTLERGEASLSALKDELRSLRGQIRELEERGSRADSIVSKNQRQEEKQKVLSFMNQREALMAEAQELRKELEEERKVTDKLKEELEEMRKEEDVEDKTEELQARLQELENKLKFEQQRSDLWERLYVESKDERAKGDRDVKTKIPKDGMLGKVKETFHAVKNSTKEFVHHHKEQIKKAKEAVKENLRKFSDSFKTTFRHFKDSNIFHRDKPEHHSFQQEQGNMRTEDWQPQKPLHHRKSTFDSFHADHNTRKPSAQRPHGIMGQKTPLKSCSGVFDCAYQESMTLFNKAMDPIRADEFNELLRSYLQNKVVHFHHWRELESFIANFFLNGVFIHDQMLFSDFVSNVEDYLEEMDEYHRLSDDVFDDLDDYIYRHIFGDAYLKYFVPSRPFERSRSKVKAWRHCQQHPRPQRTKKWSQTGRDPNRQFPDVKIELGPMPFDPKY
ncbi:cell cycle progression protein 1 isoform X1 [Carassius auratus]|uniref:Cell cycle progression protein 1 isoform X1 n=1 Tax=Carassius auratus TaxID=7957 RepID=A0A6P6RBE1_CARAU|nr:cell cycle progression protein 1 isoform X1 [Carassius auratus]